ncbi:tetratricopeptide repeat protein [Micromonospora purpureochromogenes]|uniref:tetratricopeptide repeat protein n=1 Tax=Micromonospora purpureochromogenes TaxID=47872 RepID=UPI0033F83D80
MDRIAKANESYQRAVFGGDPSVLAEAERSLDVVEADLALARGRILHARFLDDRVEDPRELPLFQRAAELYRQLGDARGEAEALFWVGCVHQVIRQDEESAAQAFARARELATGVGDRLTLSYVLRHLAFAEQAAGRFDVARQRMEESTRLRRDIGFQPGVAANLVGLAFLAIGDGRREDARALVEEAAATAEASGAHGVLRWVAEARAALPPPA